MNNFIGVKYISFYNFSIVDKNVFIFYLKCNIIFLESSCCSFVFNLVGINSLFDNDVIF